MKAAIVAAVVAVVCASASAGALLFPHTVVKTRTVADHRPRISNHATAAEVEANFAGEPRAKVAQSPIPGFDCFTYGSDFAVVDAGGPAFIIELCTRGLPA